MIPSIVGPNWRRRKRPRGLRNPKTDEVKVKELVDQYWKIASSHEENKTPFKEVDQELYGKTTFD